MTGFLDIALRSKAVSVAGMAVTIRALSLGDIAELALRFKPFEDLINRNIGFKAGDLLKLGAPVVAALIAAGVGHVGKAEYEAKAAQLAAGDQAMLLLELYEVSFPEDVRRPFAALFERLFAINLNLAPGPPPTTSPLPSAELVSEAGPANSPVSRAA